MLYALVFIYLFNGEPAMDGTLFTDLQKCEILEGAMATKLLHDQKVTGFKIMEPCTKQVIPQKA